MSKELKMVFKKPSAGKVKDAAKSGGAIVATVVTIAGAAVVEGVQGAVTGKNPNTLKLSKQIG